MMISVYYIGYQWCRTASITCFFCTWRGNKPEGKWRSSANHRSRYEVCTNFVQVEAHKLTQWYTHRTVIADCVIAMKRSRITEPYPGEELRIFFFKLSVWLMSPMTLVFVFERPQINDPWWRSLAREIIQYFGYYSIEVRSNINPRNSNLIPLTRWMGRAVLSLLI